MVLLKRFNNKKSKQQKLAMKQQSLKIFLDAEKNMFEQLKLFINIPFLLTAGCLAAIFQFDHKDRCSIYILATSIIVQMVTIMVAMIFLNSSMRFIAKCNYKKFKKFRMLYHFTIYVYIWLSTALFIAFVIYYITK